MLLFGAQNKTKVGKFCLSVYILSQDSRFRNAV